jgi:hypothetical protein
MLLAGLMLGRSSRLQLAGWQQGNNSKEPSMVPTG